MHGTSGSIGRQIVLKQYNGKTVVAHYPDMSKVVYTKAQLAERIRFKLAVAYARAVIADPAKKKSYSSKKHFSPYHAAISDYLNRSKAEEKEKPSIVAVVKPVPTVINSIEPHVLPSNQIDNRKIEQTSS